MFRITFPDWTKDGDGMKGNVKIGREIQDVEGNGLRAKATQFRTETGKGEMKERGEEGRQEVRREAYTSLPLQAEL